MKTATPSNPANQLVSSISGDETTLFTYDPAGRLLDQSTSAAAAASAAKAGAGKIARQFTYGFLDNVLQANRPDGGRVGFDYYPDGQLAAKGPGIELTKVPDGKKKNAIAAIADVVSGQSAEADLTPNAAHIERRCARRTRLGRPCAPVAQRGWLCCGATHQRRCPRRQFQRPASSAQLPSQRHPRHHPRRRALRSRDRRPADRLRQTPSNLHPAARQLQQATTQAPTFQPRPPPNPSQRVQDSQLRKSKRLNKGAETNHKANQNNHHNETTTSHNTHRVLTGTHLQPYGSSSNPENHKQQVMNLKSFLILSLALVGIAGQRNGCAADSLPGLATQPVSYFYTGKPYEEDLGGYVFKHRTYCPDVNRWTTPDPTGFPDGVNNFLYVNNVCLYSLDSSGLQITLYNKPVMGGDRSWVHSYIYFKVTDCDGKEIEGTVSGQPEGGWPNFGKLKSVPNSDLRSARNNAVDIDWSAAGWKDEYCFYLDLIGAQNAYRNNLAYWPRPTLTSETDYNSNGFISGILGKLGVSAGYTEETATGWSVPIPSTYTIRFKNNQNCCE